MDSNLSRVKYSNSTRSKPRDPEQNIHIIYLTGSKQRPQERKQRILIQPGLRIETAKQSRETKKDKMFNNLHIEIICSFDSQYLLNNVVVNPLRI